MQYEMSPVFEVTAVDSKPVSRTLYLSRQTHISLKFLLLQLLNIWRNPTLATVLICYVWTITCPFFKSSTMVTIVHKVQKCGCTMCMETTNLVDLNYYLYSNKSRHFALHREDNNSLQAGLRFSSSSKLSLCFLSSWHHQQGRGEATKQPQYGLEIDWEIGRERLHEKEKDLK